MDNIVRVAFSGASRFARTIPVTRQDRGVWLLFENVDVPDTFQVHFSHIRSNNGTAKTWMGTKENGVLIPDEYLISGKTVYAWIFVQEDDSGMSKYMAEIPVYATAGPIDGVRAAGGKSSADPDSARRVIPMSAHRSAPQ